MRYCLALLPLAMLGAAPLMAQEHAPASVYSLVVVERASSVEVGPVPDCGEVICADRISAAGFQGVTTLAGPDLGEGFGANLLIHQALRQEGVLAIVRTDPDGSHVIERLRRGGEGGRACLDEADLVTFGLADAPIERQGGYACHAVAGRSFDGMAVTLVAEQAPVEVPTQAVVEFTRSAPFIGVPVGCEGPDQICIAELYEGQATPVRHISGEELPRRFTLRFTSHAMRVGPGVRMLVFARPFVDGASEGYYAQWWATERFDGLYCETEVALRRFPPGPVRTAFENGVTRHGRETDTYAAADYRCIWSG